MPPTREQVIEAVKSSPHERVKVAITDADGILRGKYLHKNKFLAALDGGFGFCNVVLGWDANDDCYDNSKFTGWHSGYPDAQVALDPSTFRTIPWDDNVPFLLGDFVDAKGEPLSVCPRQLLKKQVARARAMGYEASFGYEFEWFNFAETPQSFAAKGYRDPAPLTPGMFGYSVLRSSLNRDYFTALMENMERFRVPLEGLHTETGPGVYEAAIAVTDALEAADRAALFKTGAKEIAYRHGVMASFMAKWNPALPGCGGHVHQSLWQNDKNVFYDESRPYKMSKLFEHYLAGQMLLIGEMLPFLAPTVNSFKRLVEGMWAPTRITWGVDNRTVAFRVIQGSKKSERLETRVGGADLNPYLAGAAMLGAGLYGIEKKLELPSAAVVGNGYTVEAPTLPKNLYDAAQAMLKSELARRIFGDDMVEHFAQSRVWEWRQFQKAVTSWELERYFEII
jgi:glutamine synthetase